MLSRITKFVPATRLVAVRSFSKTHDILAKDRAKPGPNAPEEEPRFLEMVKMFFDR